MSEIANELRFLMAEKERDQITIRQLKKIRKIYEDASKDFARNYKMLKGRENISSILRRQYIDDMQKNLRKEITKATKEIEAGIEGAILQTSQSVIADNQLLLNKMGFGFKKAYSFVPDDVVKTIVSGQLYQSDWTLSKAIWGDNKKTLSDIDTIIAKGITENKGSFDIAKDLEKYVNPSAAKEWDWSKVYPGTKRKVEYNSQRLARTMVSHAYQESFQRATQKNPFIENYRWETSNSHTTCDLCISRATSDAYGLGAGIYPKDSLPLDHPNGKCIVVSVLAGSMSDISDQIADWYNSPEGTYPDIDSFAKSLDGIETKTPIRAYRRATETTKTTTTKTFAEKYGTSTKSKNAWYKSLTSEQKEEAIKLKEESGLTWEKWYGKNVYTGDPSKLARKPRNKSKSTTPEYSNWINEIKNQKQSHMLEKEQEWLKLIGDDGKNGIVAYSGSAYRRMNSYLRLLQKGHADDVAKKMSGIDANEMKKLNHAIEGLNNVKLDKPYIVRRGTDVGDLAGAFMDGDFETNKAKLAGMSAEELHDMFKGSVGQFGSLTSTSSIWSRGFSGDVEIVMYAPEGTSAASIMKISRFGTSEGEMLFNANTFVKCLGVEKSDGHKGSSIRVFMEVLKKI